MQAALLVHSGGFTSRQWRRLAQALSAEYRVVTPDLLGYATPWPNGKPFHFQEDLAFLESLADEPMHLVGHSYGGFLSLQLAIKRPELVRSIAVYDPVAFGALGDFDDDEASKLVTRPWQPDASGVDEAWLELFVDWWNGRGTWTHLPAETRDAFRATGWKVYQEVTSLAADRTSAATYGTIKAPTLVMGGAKSPALERRVVETLVASLPHARLRLFETAGHMGPITHAAEVNAAIGEHVRTATHDS